MKTKEEIKNLEYIILKLKIPYACSFLRRYRSASLPMGTRNIAEAKRVEVVTQVIKTASSVNSYTMDNSAILTADPLLFGVQFDLRTCR